MKKFYTDPEVELIELDALIATDGNMVNSGDGGEIGTGTGGGDQDPIGDILDN